MSKASQRRQYKLKVFMVGPYSTGPKSGLIASLNNIRVGLQTGWRLVKIGFIPFIPWLDFLLALVGPLTVKEFQDYTIEWLPCCDCVLRLPGWHCSKGALREIEEAERLGLPIFDRFKDLRMFRKKCRGEY